MVCPRTRSRRQRALASNRVWIVSAIDNSDIRDNVNLCIEEHGLDTADSGSCDERTFCTDTGNSRHKRHSCQRPKLQKWIRRLHRKQKLSYAERGSKLKMIASLLASDHLRPIQSTSIESAEPSLRLPQEVIDHAISFLWNWQEALEDCKLVSRACYSYVSTFSGILRLRSAGALSALSHPHAHAAEKLRRVHTLMLSDSTASWLYRVPLVLSTALANVTDLHLYNWSPAHVPLHPAVLRAFAHLRSVSALSLTGCCFKSVVQLQRLLGAFPGLRMLALYGVYILVPQTPAEAVSDVFYRPSPQLETLVLGTSSIGRPGQGTNLPARARATLDVAGSLAGWLGQNMTRLKSLRLLILQIVQAHLQEGELASIGQLVTAVAPHIVLLGLDFVGAQGGSQNRAANWANLKLDSCISVQTLLVSCSSPRLQELILLSPECHVKELILVPYTKAKKSQTTDWAALATTLGGSAFTKLKRVVNQARVPQNPTEASALDAFVACMRTRSTLYEDRTKFPFSHNLSQERESHSSS